MVGELYSYIANGSVVMLLCGTVIAIVLLQALLFVRQAYRQGVTQGIPKPTLNKVIANSAVFSVVPSIPILLVYVMLMPSMGKYFPWLRLSVVGSGSYEYLAADTAATALGFFGMSDPALSPAAFITIMWVATICILGGPITATFFLKRIDKTVTAMSMKKNTFAPSVAGAMFIGMLTALALPKALDFGNMLGVVTLLVSGASVMLMNALAKKSGVKVLADFSFPIAMLIGMGASVALGGVI